MSERISLLAPVRILEVKGLRSKSMTVLDFRYQVVQLNQLSCDTWLAPWGRDYVNNPNTVACALMAKMNIAPADRPRV